MRLFSNGFYDFSSNLRLNLNLNLRNRNVRTLNVNPNSITFHPKNPQGSENLFRPSTPKLPYPLHWRLMEVMFHAMYNVANQIYNGARLTFCSSPACICYNILQSAAE